MNQQEQEVAVRLASLLDEAARDVQAPVAERLAAARAQAMERYQARPGRELSWIPAWHTGGARVGGGFRHSYRFVVFAAVVLSALAIGVNWHSMRGPDIADIDAALLTDELPINAFLDQSFDSWVKRGSR